MTGLKPTYFIKAPRKDRRSWAIVGYVLDGGKRQYFTPESTKNQIKSLNSQIDILTPAQIQRQIEVLILGLYKIDGNVEVLIRHSMLSQDNHTVLDRYWTDVYGAKELEDPDSMRYDLIRTLKLIEPNSILTSSATQLRESLKKNRKNIQQHRRAVDRLNQLLKYLKRDIRLEKPKAGIKSIRYMNRAELEAMLKKVKDPVLADLYMTLFGSGMRLSEAMAIEPSSIRNPYIRIDKQLRAGDAEPKLPKREKTGDSVMLDFSIEACKRWAEVKDKDQYRSVAQTYIKKIADKPFSIHDLRHSHAIYLLSLGATLTHVALNLRNRIEVCQKYYTGFSHTNETLEHLSKVLKDSEKKPSA